MGIKFFFVHLSMFVGSTLMIQKTFLQCENSVQASILGKRSSVMEKMKVKKADSEVSVVDPDL